MAKILDFSSGNVDKCELLTEEDVLQEEEVVEKANTTKSRNTLF